MRFKDLVLDAVDPQAAAIAWAAWLHLRAEQADADMVLRGDRPEQTVWIDAVDEPGSVKNRVHLDLLAHDLGPFVGAEQVTASGELPWTVFATADGLNFCVFESADRTPGLKDVVVDARDHRAIAAWWADIWGGVLGSDDDYTWLDEIPGAPVESFDFVPVPEPKTSRNRIRWDVTLLPGARVEDLLAAGASLIADPPDPWTVLADPEGNEFSVFGA